MPFAEGLSNRMRLTQCVRESSSFEFREGMACAEGKVRDGRFADAAFKQRSASGRIGPLHANIKTRLRLPFSTLGPSAMRG